MIGCITALGAFWLYGYASPGGIYTGSAFMLRTAEISAIRAESPTSTLIYGTGMVTQIPAPFAVVTIALSKCGEET